MLIYICIFYLSYVCLFVLHDDTVSGWNVMHHIFLVFSYISVFYDRVYNQL